MRGKYSGSARAARGQRLGSARKVYSEWVFEDCAESARAAFSEGVFGRRLREAPSEGAFERWLRQASSKSAREVSGKCADRIYGRGLRKVSTERAPKVRGIRAGRSYRRYLRKAPSKSARKARGPRMREVSSEGIFEKLAGSAREVCGQRKVYSESVFDKCAESARGVAGRIYGARPWKASSKSMRKARGKRAGRVVGRCLREVSSKSAR